jgi:cyclopropane fatty-acyl-phospholipid synthase-like methyltransferase
MAMSGHYHTRESVEEYIRMARGHDGRKIIARLRTHLPDGSSLLEIGSGPGTDWKLLGTHFKVLGSDSSPEFLRHLKKTYPEGEFMALDAASLDTRRHFDGIYSNKVLHHLEEEELHRSVKRQAEILQPDGIVCHSFWHGQGPEMYNDLFVNYHTDEGILRLFRDYFKPLCIQYYKEFEEGDSFFYIGQKKKGPAP